MKLDIKLINKARTYWLVDIRFYPTGEIVSASVSQEGPVLVQILGNAHYIGTYVKVVHLKSGNTVNVCKDYVEIFETEKEAVECWNREILRERDRRTQIHEKIVDYYNNLVK